MEPDMMDNETPDYCSFLGKGQAPKKKRKRGGIAGLWDRNKKIIAPVVSGALGLVNPGLGMAAGAAMRGLDRPGKRGIGFDVGQGLRGAAEGGLATIGARGLQGAMLGAQGGGGLRGAMQGGTQAVRQAVGMPAAAEMGGGMAEAGAAPMGGAPASAVAGGGNRGLARALQFIAENPQPIGMGLQAASGIMGAQEQRRIEEERQREDRRRAENLARLAMPMYVESFRGRR